jgi:hypothetical protein
MTIRQPRIATLLVLAASLTTTLSTAGGLQAASVRTTNFVVVAARQDDAEEFARLAEHFRKAKAIEWLGKEMPAWKEPCELRVTINASGAGGATTFDFNNPNAIYQEMHIEGNRERLKNSVLPHEITHTVFAFHFRQPVPRWADEGGSVYSEDELERSRHDKLCKQILNAGDGIQLSALFAMKQYPRQVMVLYAQGYSVSKYLIEKSDRQTFLNFVAAGLRGNWDGAVKEYYGHRNVDELQKAWIDHLKTGRIGESAVASRDRDGSRPAPLPASGVEGRAVTFDSSLPAQPVFDPAPTASRGFSPSPGTRSNDRSNERFSGDIGWNRPPARLLPPIQADLKSDLKPVSSLGPIPAPPKGYIPSAILLPPESAPYR